MFKRERKIKIILGIFLVSLFLLLPHVSFLQEPGGAVGFKILPNPEKLSPLEWYQTYIPPSKQGRPREIIIDGYQAVEDGRSVYVNAANLVSGELFTNIYVFSYDLNDPDGKTKEIFDRIRENLKFTVSPDFSRFGQGTCSVSGRSCTIDLDCGADGPCVNSSGDKIRRDTRRASDLAFLSKDLQSFRNAFGTLPQLLSGTFVPGISFSPWPSWRDTLSKELGIELFQDPLNKFVCPKLDNVDPVTCWDFVQKTFVCPLESYTYVYQYSRSGTEEIGSFGTRFETSQAETYWQPGSVNIDVAGCSFPVFASVSDDVDADAVPNSIDNCANITNPGQQDADGDGRGNVCDVCPFDRFDDADGDGFCADVDNCPFVTNSDQIDQNKNGIGDVCEVTCGDNIIDVARGEDCEPGVSTTIPTCQERGFDTGNITTCDSVSCRWDTSSCRNFVCGDGNTEGSEQCDPPGTLPGGISCTTNGYSGSRSDVCNSSCRIQSGPCTTTENCGDSVLNGFEQCDDGTADNSNPSDAGTCVITNIGGIYGTNNCKNNICGDGYRNTAVEQCDDGNTVSGDGCQSTCQLPICGDGFQDPGEQCDDGNTVSGDGCQADCSLPVCGDGNLDNPPETCDDGNTNNNDACTNACEPNVCGDSFLNPATEQCDDGNTVSGDGCQADCQLPICGDGFTDPGETCDDGNTNNNDACTNACEPNVCGDSFLNPATEQCDDGNTVSGDGCQADCSLPVCGDGSQDPGEQCDKTTQSCIIDNPGQPAGIDNCVWNVCGDGRTCTDGSCNTDAEAGTQMCDDGNTNNNDSCIITNSGGAGNGVDNCVPASCGDGFVCNTSSCSSAGTFEECDPGAGGSTVSNSSCPASGANQCTIVCNSGYYDPFPGNGVPECELPIWATDPQGCLLEGEFTYQGQRFVMNPNLPSGSGGVRINSDGTVTGRAWAEAFSSEEIQFDGAIVNPNAPQPGTFEGFVNTSSSLGNFDFDSAGNTSVNPVSGELTGWVFSDGQGDSLFFSNVYCQPGAGTLVNVYPTLLVSTYNGNICELDIADGSVTECKSTGLNGLMGISYDRESGRIFAATASASEGGSPPRAVYFSDNIQNSSPTFSLLFNLPNPPGYVGPTREGDIYYINRMSDGFKGFVIPHYPKTDSNSNSNDDVAMYILDDTGAFINHADQYFVNNFDAYTYSESDPKEEYIYDSSTSPDQMVAGGIIWTPTVKVWMDSAHTIPAELGGHVGMVLVGSTLYVADDGISGTGTLYTVNINDLHASPAQDTHLVPIGNYGGIDVTGLTFIPSQ